MKWMISEDRLGPDQREVINELSNNWKNTWIKGHAGSGKSVLLIHLLRDYLAKHPRAQVCVVVFTKSLVDMLRTGIRELKLEEQYNTAIPVMTIFQFTGHNHTDAIFCDEVQDLPVEFLEKLRSSSDTIIVAGDENQSIYSTVPQFNQRPAYPSEILQTLSAQPKSLSYIYRMTRSVVRLLSKVYDSLLQGRQNTQKNDVEIKVFKSEIIENEIAYVWKEASKINNYRADEIVAVLLPEIDKIISFTNHVLSINNKPQWKAVYNRFNKPDYGSMNTHLANNGIPLLYVGQGYGSLSEADQSNKIILMTYNSSKGLDFDHVFLPMLDDSIWIPDNVAKTLLFVALSRSKYNLMISYTDEPYSYLKPFIANEKVINIDSIMRETANNRLII